MGFRSATIATAVALTLLVGCAKKTDDDALTTKIKTALSSDQVTNGANIGVAVKDGIATLSGDVQSSDVALEAAKVAQNADGIKGINNQLTVNGSTAANVPPPATANTQQPAPPANTQQPAPAPATVPAQQQTPPPPPAPKPEAITYTIPAGERVTVRTIDAIDSKVNTAGQEFRASLNSPLVARGRTVVPAGADATLVLAQAVSAGKIQGRPELEVRLVSVRYRGETYRLDTNTVVQTGASRGKQTAVRTGIGSAAGAIIGAIAGGGKGAAIGSAAGAGAGFGTNYFTHGPTVRIPSEAALTFTLEAPLSITEVR